MKLVKSITLDIELLLRLNNYRKSQKIILNLSQTIENLLKNQLDLDEQNKKLSVYN